MIGPCEPQWSGQTCGRCGGEFSVMSNYKKPHCDVRRELRSWSDSQGRHTGSGLDTGQVDLRGETFIIVTILSSSHHLDAQ